MDSREAKLPKWAQEALADERRRAALAWPTEARPEPLWEPGVNTYAPGQLDGATVWQSVPSRFSPLEKVVSNRFVKDAEGLSGFGSRPEDGRFFANKREAWLDMWWARAEKASAELYAAKIGTLEAAS